ncbi:IS5 family transposase [Roseovarius nitratireducens]|uniref:IS5 family transposase n=1 Tax=Roseovarius nitratireducens TaxID=2044597 RepID=UPI000CE28E1A|nr:IS5 family transposase [Roseovarius nitratireducens]
MRQSFSTQPALFAPQELFDHPALCALDEVEVLIDWDRIAALLPAGEEKVQTGRPGYPALTLFRALLLGLWYDLSDVKLSAQLARDLLFRKFCRLELDAGVPEASTLGRFRARLGDRLDGILAELVAMLEEARVILAEGRVAIVDATVVEAARSKLSTQDPEAGSAVKITVKGRRQAVWGWQAFVNADEDGFVRRVTVSPGNRAEVDSLCDLMVGDETALYADSAYIGPRTRALLAHHGMCDRVQKHGVRRRKLTPQERARNVEIGVTRGRVEAIFGHWKRHWGLRRTRFLGAAKMQALTSLAAIGWNLWKGAGFKARYG